MTARDNILLCLEQYAAAQASSKYSVGTEHCVSNLLAVVDWTRMPTAMIRDIVTFVLDRCDARSVARMSGAANAEREALRGILGAMKADGRKVLDIDAVKQPAKPADNATKEGQMLALARGAIDEVNGDPEAMRMFIAMVALLGSRELKVSTAAVPKVA
jgi:hypothetical protein